VVVVVVVVVVGGDGSGGSERSSCLAVVVVVLVNHCSDAVAVERTWCKLYAGPIGRGCTTLTAEPLELHPPHAPLQYPAQWDL
jgi:hypothetical protein